MGQQSQQLTPEGRARCRTNSAAVFPVATFGVSHIASLTPSTFLTTPSGGPPLATAAPGLAPALFFTIGFIGLPRAAATPAFLKRYQDILRAIVPGCEVLIDMTDVETSSNVGYAQRVLVHTRITKGPQSSLSLLASAAAVSAPEASLGEAPGQLALLQEQPG